MNREDRYHLYVTALIASGGFRTRSGTPDMSLIHAHAASMLRSAERYYDEHVAEEPSR